MSSGCVEGNINTTTCAPLRCSSAASWLSSCCACCAESVPVRSVTRAFSTGTATSACATPVNANNRPANSIQRWSASFTLLSVRARSGRRRRGRPEVHLRRGRDRSFVVDREVGFHLVPEYPGGQVDRKAADVAVVILHRLDVAVASYRDAVFGALQLRLEVL